MWFAGALIGLVVASSIGHDLMFAGAIIGGLIGHWWSGKSAGTRPSAGMDERLKKLELEVALLRAEVAALLPNAAPRATAAPETPPAAPPPRTADAIPDAGLDLANPRASAATAQAEDVTAAPRPERKPITTTAMPQPAAPAIEMPDWVRKIWAGNPLAKAGIVLLFFGVASGLKLAAEHGLMPVPLRLFLAAAAGIGLIAFGVAKVREETHRTFGLSIQGGGFALLYLVAYFMLERHSMIGQGLAFSLFAALGVVCVVLAARQDGPALAALGLSGAFLAPVLAGGNAAPPLPLFSYFALLNVFIIAVDWFKSWRMLNIAGFIFTLAVGMAWAVDGYREEHYLVTQIFLAAFLAVYSAMPAATALLKAPGFAGWSDGVLLFGTPLIGIFLQARLLEDVAYGLAWSTLIASLWYFALWGLMFRRPEPEIRLVERSHLGIAIALLTASVPMAFDAQVTSAFWAIEGAAVLWFGVRTCRLLAQGVGLLMQIAAGIALALGWQHLGHGHPFANDAVFGAFILCMAGLFSARLLRQLEGPEEFPPVLPLGWALLWWFGTGLGEIERFAAATLHAPYGLLYVAATTLALEGLARRWHWPQLRANAILLLAGLWIAALLTTHHSGHPLAGAMILVMPLALALHYWLLTLHEKHGAAPFPAIRHIGAWWLVLATLAEELTWQAGELAPGVPLWSFVGLGLVLAAGCVLPALGRARHWPFNAPDAPYHPVAVAPPLALLLLLLPWANLQLTGGTGTLALPYLPILNFFDITQLAGMLAILRTGQEFADEWRSRLRVAVAALAFIWLSALAARIALHWGGIPFTFADLMRAHLFQALLTLFWTVSAIATMIAGSRRDQREPWFGGFGLLGVVGAKLLFVDAAGRGTLTWTATLIGVALLVLAASYFAPLPPKAEPRSQAREAEDHGTPQEPAN